MFDSCTHLSIHACMSVGIPMVDNFESFCSRHIVKAADFAANANVASKNYCKFEKEQECRDILLI